MSVIVCTCTLYGVVNGIPSYTEYSSASRELGGCKCLMLRRIWYAYRLPLCILLFTRFSLSTLLYYCISSWHGVARIQGQIGGRHRVTKLTLHYLEHSVLSPTPYYSISVGRLSAKCQILKRRRWIPKASQQECTAADCHCQRACLFMNCYNYKVSFSFFPVMSMKTG